MDHDLKGWVNNNTGGVTIRIEGKAHALQAFMKELPEKAPVVAEIDHIETEKVAPGNMLSFSIHESLDNDDETSEISPDIAVCPECLSDMKEQPNRLDYPFINCTNCGPRFSIIRDFPYDRHKTTMAPFAMCPHCRKEYLDIADRRFHAQPVACNDCGPMYTLYANGSEIPHQADIMEMSIKILTRGGLMAIKGTGGFHLACDAFSEDAVGRLRDLKHREGKPFAVMFRDLASIRKYAIMSPAEEASLLSWKRPIVILEASRQPSYALAKGLNTLGVFLPYMPWHHLFFEKSGMEAMVLTSCNLSDEPIVIDNNTARKVFSPLTDGILTYNREIFNRTDDSVVRIMSGQERLLRRSRGYVPAAIRLRENVHGILAVGAELSNCFCLGKGTGAYLSQYIGDLKNNETLDFFEETIERFCRLFRVTPDLVAADMHPDYLSTRYALTSGKEIVRIQHHHAHIVSCMAENGISEPVIGLAFDGTGYGDDGNIWGSEFMVCDHTRYERHAHFAAMPMPGGDKASENPWRMGLSLLYQAFGEGIFNLDLPFLHRIGKTRIQPITGALRQNINSPLSTGAGRLFDAVAAITDICPESLFHAEAPMRLEAVAKMDEPGAYETCRKDGISFLPAIEQICHDLTHHVDPAVISARFHNTVKDAALGQISAISKSTGIHKVVLSGGTFQNKFLFESLETTLVKHNFVVYSHRQVPSNDSGLALGQLVIAAARKAGKVDQ